MRIGDRYKGWAYFIPVVGTWIEANGVQGMEIRVRWLGWKWPVVVLMALHQILCTIHGQPDRGMTFDFKEYEE